jgi:LPS sulfotransferase NodH
MNTWKNDPVIVIGMHRSGTTMLAKVLNKLGIFMGENIEHNSESIPFLKLNEQIFTKYKIKWSNVIDAEGTIDQYFEGIKNCISSEIIK